MRYRLALDLGSTSLGWAMVRLTEDNSPCAIIKAGARIFSDGRNPKDGSSLAVTRREARAMRRRRDRLLRRKARVLRLLTEHGFMPAEEPARRALLPLNPYEIRARGLDQPLTPAEFARALFHLNQRRGFKSNRKTDRKATDSGALKGAIQTLRSNMLEQGCRTVGEWLYRRQLAGKTQRARYRERKETVDGRNRIHKSYDLYIDRAMIEAEFDLLWKRQAEFAPEQFTEAARTELRDALLYQRSLKPVRPGRCTLMPDQERALLALPSTQRFRIYQEVNNLRLLQTGHSPQSLTLAQRDTVVAALEHHGKRTFTQLRRLLGLSGSVEFNVEDVKRPELKGNATAAVLSRPEYLGDTWYTLGEATQDEITRKLLTEESEPRLVAWLQAHCGVDEDTAEAMASAQLPEGYGSLSEAALSRILPELRRDVTPYSTAVQSAGFDHHSHLGPGATGEILSALPYYGEVLQRHVSFGSGNPEDPPERRYGRIANPTVHIGLNQVRGVVNELITRYGHPSEVILELARDLKQSRAMREEDQRRQADHQRRNERIRTQIAQILEVEPTRVRHADIQKFILWEELSRDPADRHCPYSGVQISAHLLLSDQVEIEHILPFSVTLDDSLNNKTVAMRQANRIKGNRTPWQAFGAEQVPGFDYASILQRVSGMPRQKRYRFAEDGHAQWLRDDAGFLARALNDTRYLSRVAREYLSCVCPHGTRVIPGQMTALLRGKFGLNDVLGVDGQKNRDDHRHHAVDACVIAVTDQGLLQRFAQASASAREQQLGRLVAEMPLPWPNYRHQVEHAVRHIWVSHKPDHGHEGGMHNDTAYGLLGDGRVRTHKWEDGRRVLEEKPLSVIPFAEPKASQRHGNLPDGSPRPYKGYKGDSNYCLEVVRNEKGKWEGEVISTFEAYQIVRVEGVQRLRNPTLSISGRPLVMRLIINDVVRLEIDGRSRCMRVAGMNMDGRLSLADLHEANVDARNRDKAGSWRYTYKSAGSLKAAKGRRCTVSPAGVLRDPGEQA